jgi:uncharacterized repeat protein (TIGR03803 family)
MRRSAGVATLTLLASCPASAQSLQVVHTFPGTTAPLLTKSLDGFFYGIAGGTLYQMSPDGTLTVLCEGASEGGPLVRATDGNFYGANPWGGDYGLGDVYRMTPGCVVTELHSFSDSPDGRYPNAPLVQASSGDLFGTTQYGGVNPCDSDTTGTIFKVTLAGDVEIVHSFDWADEGCNPIDAPLIQASDGNLYGTTEIGGDWGGGIVYQMTLSGAVSVMHSFAEWYIEGAGAGPDGALPEGPIVQGPDGYIYGITATGGPTASYSNGVVYKMALDGTEAVVCGFSSGGIGAPGAVVLTTDGSIYGIAATGTVEDLIKISQDGSFKVLYTFTQPDVIGGLVQGPSGSVYASTYYAAPGYGAIVKLTLPDLVVSSLTVPAVSGAGSPLVIKDVTRNTGSGYAGSSTTQLFLSHDPVVGGTDVLLGSRTVPALATTKGNSGATAITIPSDTPTGTYYLIAKANALDQVPETSETNNTLAKPIKIGPDLRVLSVVAPSTATLGSTITVSDSTTNGGGGSDQVVTQTGFYLSPTSTQLSIPLGYRTVPVLGPKATDSGSISVTIPSDIAVGNYYIVAHADDANAVVETSEGDNKRSTRITIVR